MRTLLTCFLPCLTTTSSGRLEDLLAQCPALRRLFVDFRKSSLAVTLDRPIEELAPQLDEVRLLGIYSAVEAILPRLSACSRVAVDAVVDGRGAFIPTLLADIGPLDQLVLSSVKVPGWSHDTDTMRAISGSCTRALIHPAPDMDIPAVLALHATTLVSLTLADPYWRNLRVPTLPALRTFIMTAYPIAAASGLPRPAAHAWKFPALQHLCVGNSLPSLLSSSSSWMDCPFDRKELAFVLRKALGFSPKRKLRRLDVINIDLTGEDAAPGRRVEDVVEELHIRRDPDWNGLYLP